MMYMTGRHRKLMIVLLLELGLRFKNSNQVIKMLMTLFDDDDDDDRRISKIDGNRDKNNQLINHKCYYRY